MTAPTNPRRGRLIRLLLPLAAVPVVAIAALFAVSEYALRHRFDVPKRDIKASTDGGTLARGRYLATVINKCVECHGEDFGGQVMVDDPLFARLAAPNLTRGVGGIGATLAPALASYITQLPPVDRPSPGTSVRAVGRALYLAGKLPLLAAEMIDHDKVGAPQDRDTPQGEGKYLAWVGGCHGCHGENLKGGPIPGLPPELPPAANISSQALANWSYEDFQRVLRTGVRPDGRKLHPLMPYRLTTHMKESEIQALFAYLKGAQVAAHVE